MVVADFLRIDFGARPCHRMWLDAKRFATLPNYCDSPCGELMADFMHGLDPGKLVLSGAVRPSLPPAPMSSRFPGVVIYPQPVRSTRVQPAHLFIRSPRPREQRRRPVAQVGTRPVPSRRTRLTWHSSRASCRRRSCLISSGCSTTTKAASPSSSSFSSGYSRRVHTRTRRRAR